MAFVLQHLPLLMPLAIWCCNDLTICFTLSQSNEIPQNTQRIIVKLLLARLTWDWTSYEKLQHGGKFKDIESQAGRLDICHYAFPNNLDLFLKGIGQMKAVEENRFEGCGSFNTVTKVYLKKEFLDLNNTLKSLLINDKLNKDDLIRIWLMLCLAKTIKENLKISIPISGIED